jgi:hypothetical protein
MPSRKKAREAEHSLPFFEQAHTRVIGGSANHFSKKTDLYRQDSPNEQGKVQTERSPLLHLMHCPPLPQLLHGSKPHFQTPMNVSPARNRCPPGNILGLLRYPNRTTTTILISSTWNTLAA